MHIFDGEIDSIGSIDIKYLASPRKEIVIKWRLLKREARKRAEEGVDHSNQNSTRKGLLGKTGQRFVESKGVPWRRMGFERGGTKMKGPNLNRWSPFFNSLFLIIAVKKALTVTIWIGIMGRQPGISAGET
eukprot:scaffold4061_cov108-Cylindrotheca_fusiformis.AAC.17